MPQAKRAFADLLGPTYAARGRHGPAEAIYYVSGAMAVRRFGTAIALLGTRLQIAVARKSRETLASQVLGKEQNRSGTVEA
eukprot:7299765-Pyramimonas_sp.AAC.1